MYTLGADTLQSSHVSVSIAARCTFHFGLPRGGHRGMEFVHFLLCVADESRFTG